VPRITDIKPQKRQKRVNLFLDGEFSFGLSLEALAKFGLEIGQVLPDEKVEKIIKEEELLKVYNRVLKFLSYRPRSRKEIDSWFKRKKVGKETQNLVFKKLKKQNLIDDYEFANWWIDQRASFRPRGARLLKVELRQKGISERIINKVLNQKKLKSSEEKLAQKAASKKIRSLKNLSREKAREKLAAFLLRRGFSWEVTKKVADEA